MSQATPARAGAAVAVVGGAGHAHHSGAPLTGNTSREIFPKTREAGNLTNARGTMNTDNTIPATVGTPAAGILTYTAAAVLSLANEAAKAAASEESKGIAADAWACAVLIGDAVMEATATGTARAALFDTAAAAAAETFKAARIAATGTKDAGAWPAFASARSTMKNGLFFGAYAPGLSKAAVTKASKAARTAAQHALMAEAQRLGLIPQAPAAEAQAQELRAVAARNGAERDELRAQLDAMRAELAELDAMRAVAREAARIVGVSPDNLQELRRELAETDPA